MSTITGQLIVPDKAKLNFFNATNLLGANAANFKLSLIASTWTPNNANDEVYADVSGELATANGYTNGGIALTGVALALIPSQTISSITRSGTTATVTTASPHGLSTGHYVTVHDAVDVLYNGLFSITVTGSTTFTYTMTGTPGANATVVGGYTGVVTFTFTAPVWTASGGSIAAFRRCLLRYNGTLNAKVNPIVGHFLGDATGIDVPATSSGATLTIAPPATGILAF